jgi:hypothetical protein
VTKHANEDMSSCPGAGGEAFHRQVKIVGLFKYGQNDMNRVNGSTFKVFMGRSYTFHMTSS